MGRPETRIKSSDGPVAEFALTLREIRQKAGAPKYRAMAAKANYSAPSLSEAAKGSKLPTLEATRAFLKACNVTEGPEFDRCIQRWHETNERLQQTKNTTLNRHPAPMLVKDRAQTPPAVVFGPLTLHTRHTQVAKVGGSRLEPANPGHVELPSNPQPGLSDQHTDLLMALNRLRARKDLSLREIAERSLDIRLDGIGMRALASSTTHDVLTGKLKPDMDFVRLYLAAIGSSPDENQDVFLALEHFLQEELHTARGRAALQALKGDPPLAGAPPSRAQSGIMADHNAAAFDAAAPQTTVGEHEQVPDDEAGGDPYNAVDVTRQGKWREVRNQLALWHAGAAAFIVAIVGIYSAAPLLHWAVASTTAASKSVSVVLLLTVAVLLARDWYKHDH